MGAYATNMAVVLLLALCSRHSAAALTLREEVCGTMPTTATVDVSKDINIVTSFTANVESVVDDMGYILNSDVSFIKNMGLRVTAKTKDVDDLLYYDFINQQTLVYNFMTGGRGSCTVDSDMRPKIGYWLIPERPGVGDIWSTMDVLRLSGASGFPNEKIKVYLDTKVTTLRSLKVKSYISCQQITDHSGTPFVAKVTHYVTDDKFSRREKGTIPVRIAFTGKYKAADDFITHTYNFFHYSSYADPHIETPPGIVCKGRKGPSNFPAPPTYISFAQETHFPADQQRPIKYMRGTYDQGLGIVIETDFNPMSGKMNSQRYDDFNTGISYQLDPNTRFCSVSNITKDPLDDFATNPDGTIRIKTPAELFDSTVDYHYSGKKHFRGIETEAWVGAKGDSVIEWYFIWNVQHTMNDFAKNKNKRKVRIPYKRMQWADKSDNHVTDYFYKVDYTTPSQFPNLEDCYPNDLQRVWLYLPGLQRNILSQDYVYTKRRALMALTNALNIKTTRISNFRFMVIEGKGYITFNLLGKPHKSNDVHVNLQDQPTIQEAIETLQKKLKTGSLRFNVGSKKITVESLAELTDAPSGANVDDVTKPNAGYSSGALAGLAVAMAVIGLASGGGAGYWFLIRNK